MDSTDDNYLETRCIGMQGTNCVSGNGLGVVVATGDETVLGRLAKSMNESKAGMTTREKEILHFVIIASVMLTVIVLAIFLLRRSTGKVFKSCTPEASI